MERVEEFKKELLSIYETRPPVSKTKMSAITKLAVRSVKHYKHVVQIVEKMIAKCRSDYKVPGCYVIDSIVRQSRQKFGADNDMYGPRFAKNLLTTTRNLMQCSAGDEENIVRVLTLWQSKHIFSDDVTKPALALAKEISEENKAADESLRQALQEQTESYGPSGSMAPSTSWAPQVQSVTPPIPSVPVQSFSAYGGFMPSAPATHMATMQYWPQTVDMTTHLSQYEQGYVDDFDYEDDESDREPLNIIQPPSEMQSHLRMVSGNSQAENGYLPALPPLPAGDTEKNTAAQREELEDQQRTQPAEPARDKSIVGRRTIKRFQKKPQVQEEDDMDIDNPSDEDPDVSFNGKQDSSSMSSQAVGGHSLGNARQKERVSSESESEDHNRPWEDVREQTGVGKRPHSLTVESQPKTKRQSRWGQGPGSVGKERVEETRGERENAWPQHTATHGGRLTDSASQPSSERHGGNDRHWEREREDYTTRRDTGRDSDRSLHSDRGRADERQWEREQRDFRDILQSDRRGDVARHGPVDREQYRVEDKYWERDNRRGQFPVVRKDTLSVCSCTVWVGHLKKTVSERQVRGLFEDYGEIQTVDMVPPRGCAYVCMAQRLDAAKALEEFSSRKVSIGRQMCKFAWALPIVCSSYREHWNEPLGVVYIPWEKVSSVRADITSLSQGSVLDPATIPPSLREAYELMMSEKESQHTRPPPITAPITIQSHPLEPASRFGRPPHEQHYSRERTIHYDNYFDRTRFH